MKGNALIELMAFGLAVGVIKIYGEYKYYSGKVDANNTWKIIVESQKKIISELREEVD